MNRMNTSPFFSIYNFKDEKGRGRAILLIQSVVFGIGNIFVTGSFYTAFLAENGIDIVRVGIMTFIPYFCWIFSLFSPLIFQKIQRRRWILLANHVFYYSCILLATTVMPRLVQDYGKRTLWFAFFLILGNLSNALLSNGGTAWTINFLPKGRDRQYYLSINNLAGNLTGTATALLASFLADALAGSPAQSRIISSLRLVSYSLFIAIGLVHFLTLKEYPYLHDQKNLRLQDVFLKPLRNKKFLLTVLIAVFWNGFGNLNANTWTYYLLNTVHVKFIYTFITSFTCSIGGLLLVGVWRYFINKYGWLRVILFNVLITVFTETCNSFTTEKTVYLFVIGAFTYGINLIGAQITFGNVLYHQLPATDTDTYYTFYNFVVNVGIFLGSAAGTWMLSWLEGPDGGPRLLFGVPFYGPQILLWIKAVLLLLLVLYIYRITPLVEQSAEA